MNGGGSDDLCYWIEEWTTDNTKPLQVIARASILSVAYSAYWAAIAARPRGRIVLRQKALQLVEHAPAKTR